MKVAITGAKGQLGNDLLKTKPVGVETAELGREDLDIRRKEDVRAFLAGSRPDALVNAAAYVRVDDAEDESREAFDVNATGVKNLVEACREAGIPLVHISTDYVFDGRQAGKPYTEDDWPNPINAYGVSKYAGELFVRNYHEMHYIVRTCSLYGSSGARGKGGNFPLTIIDRARKGQQLRVIDDIVMSPSYSFDVASQIWKLALGGYPYGTYHVANSGACSWHVFACKILELSGIAAEVVAVAHTEYATKARRPLWSPLASSRGIALRRWEAGLQAFLEEVRTGRPG